MLTCPLKKECCWHLLFVFWEFGAPSSSLPVQKSVQAQASSWFWLLFLSGFLQLCKVASSSLITHRLLMTVYHQDWLYFWDNLNSPSPKTNFVPPLWIVCAPLNNNSARCMLAISRWIWYCSFAQNIATLKFIGYRVHEDKTSNEETQVMILGASQFKWFPLPRKCKLLYSQYRMNSGMFFYNSK